MFNDSHNSETEVDTLQWQCDFVVSNDFGNDIDAQIAAIFVETKITVRKSKC